MMFFDHARPVPRTGRFPIISHLEYEIDCGIIILMNKEDIKKILEAAVHAPSGDNSQPWRFRVADNRITIYNIPERDTTLYNFRERGSLVAHGALIENIVIAASHLGYRALPILFPESDRQEIVAAIRLEKTAPRTEPLFQAMRERASNRKPYDPMPPTDAEREILVAAARDPGGEIRLVEDTKSKKVIAQAISLNERILFENKALHTSFFQNIVWTSAEERRKKRGLYLNTLELPPPAQVAFRLFRFWPALKFFNMFGLSRQVAHTNATLYESSGAIGAILMPDESPENFIRAGSILQRVWLTATTLGLSMQALAGLLYLAQRVRGEDAAMFRAEDKERIMCAYKIIESSFDAHGRRIMMLFRIGRGKKSSARSSRLPPEIAFETTA